MSPADDLSRRGLRVPRKHVRRLEKHNGPVVTEEQIFHFVTDVLRFAARRSDRPRVHIEWVVESEGGACSWVGWGGV